MSTKATITNRRPTTIPISAIHPIDFISNTYDKFDKTPVVLVRIEGKLYLCDGHHRVGWCIRNKKKYIQGWVLRADDTVKPAKGTELPNCIYFSLGTAIMGCDLAKKVQTYFRKYLFPRGCSKWCSDGTTVPV